MTAGRLRELLAPYGKLHHVSFYAAGFGFFEFEARETAQRFQTTVNEVTQAQRYFYMDGSPVLLDYARTNRKNL